MSTRNWNALRLPATLTNEVLRDAEVEPVRPSAATTRRVRVLAPARAQVLVLIDVGIPRRGLLGGRERRGHAWRARLHEVHLRLIARHVDQVVGAAVPVHVGGEHVAGIADRPALPERGHGRAAPSEVVLRVRRRAKKRCPGALRGNAEARVVRIRDCGLFCHEPAAMEPGSTVFLPRRSCRQSSIQKPLLQILLGETARFHERPTFWFFSTTAVVTWLP